jgi:peroxiredoxin
MPHHLLTPARPKRRHQHCGSGPGTPRRGGRDVFPALRSFGAVLTGLLLGWGIAVSWADAPSNVAGRLGLASGNDVVADFSLPTPAGPPITLSDDPTAKLHVLCFLGTECPLARLYGRRLNEMAERYHDRGVRFVGINSNIQDSLEEIRAYAAAHGVGFPLAKDPDRRVALQVGATRTPEVFVIDAQREVRYQGRIDNQYEPGITRAEASSHELRDAIEQLLAGRKVAVPRTEAVGCLIALPKAAEVGGGAEEVTFCGEISRILNRHCVECHRAGEIGPFALQDYDEVVGWGDMMLEVIDQGRMPPWHASAAHGKFANAREMPASDVEKLRSWVAQGMPYGDAGQLPEPPERVRGWQLPEAPQAEFAMSDEPFEVPADGTVEYQYFVVDPHFSEDRWVRAVQVVPGNAAVVHHAIAFIRPPDGASFRDIGLLAAYVPGQRVMDLPPGYAQRIPAGSRIVFQMHYTPTGIVEHDLSRIGMVFTDRSEVTHEVYTVGGIQQDFEIPPSASAHEVRGSVGRYPAAGTLLSVSPHMHLRGKSFQLIAERAAGEETLLDVPHYDFNWQHNYQWLAPIDLSQVRQLRFVATFDNSAANPTNPNPHEYVTWGDQTWQEMAVAFLAVARPIEAASPSQPPPAKSAEGKQASDEWQREAAAFADRYLERFDKDQDGFLSRHEVPDSVRMFGFRRFDHNGDRLLSHDEIAAESLERLQRAP